MNSSLTDMVWGYTSAPPTIRLWSVWAFHSGTHCMTKLRLLWARTSCVALWRTWGSTGLCSAKGGSFVCVCVCVRKEGLCVWLKKNPFSSRTQRISEGQTMKQHTFTLTEAGQRCEKKKSCPTLQQKKKVEPCHWLRGHLTGKCNGSRGQGRVCYKCNCNRQHLYWFQSSWCTVSSDQRHHERFCGRVQKHLHRGPLQAGLRLRAGRQRRLAAPGEARREVQVFEASLPSPAEAEGAHPQLAAQIQTEEMDFRRYHRGTDSWDSSHPAGWVNKPPGSEYCFIQRWLYLFNYIILILTTAVMYVIHNNNDQCCKMCCLSKSEGFVLKYYFSKSESQTYK